MSTSPRVVQEDPYFARWGKTILPSGEELTDRLAGPKGARDEGDFRWEWVTANAAAIRRRTWMTGLFLGAMAALPGGAVFLALTDSVPFGFIGGLAAWATVTIAALAASGKALRGETGHSSLRSDRALHERDTIVRLLEEAVGGAGRTVTRRVAVTKSGSVREWRLEGNALVVFTVNVWGTSGASVGVRTRDPGGARAHAVLKGWILHVLREAPASDPKAEGTS